MPKFSLKRLFASITMIAVGCGLLAWLFLPHSYSRGFEGAIWFLSGALIGAGLLSLWHPVYGTILGAVLGFAAQLVLVMSFAQC